MADDPVVVIKAGLMRACNGVEKKKRLTLAVVRAWAAAKSAVSCEGVRHTLEL